MAEQKDWVQTGQLITAKLFNSLAKKMAELEAAQGMIPAGTVTVPVIFGKRLVDAQATLEQTGVALNLGTVIDAFGNVLDPDLPEAKGRIVINQIPGSGMPVEKGSAIGVVVAAQPGTQSQPGKKMKISGFSP